MVKRYGRLDCFTGSDVNHLYPDVNKYHREEYIVYIYLRDVANVIQIKL